MSVFETQLLRILPLSILIVYLSRRSTKMNMRSQYFIFVVEYPLVLYNLLLIFFLEALHLILHLLNNLLLIIFVILLVVAYFFLRSNTNSIPVDHLFPSSIAWSVDHGQLVATIAIHTSMKNLE